MGDFFEGRGWTVSPRGVPDLGDALLSSPQKVLIVGAALAGKGPLPLSAMKEKFLTRGVGLGEACGV